MSASDTAGSALAIGAFRRYFGASCFSTFAVWITRFLLGWTTWDLTHSAFWVGVVSAMMLLPTFVLSPLFGVISDRISARNGMLFTTASQVLLVAFAALGASLGLLSVKLLLALSFGIGAVSAAHHPMRLSLIPKMVPRELLASAIGLSAVVFNSSRILGPAIAAWLVANLSLATAFATASFGFALALMLLLFIAPVPVQQRQAPASVFNELRAGLGFIRRHKPILIILAVTAINGLFGRSVIELLPAISGQLVGGDATDLAILTACAGAGSIIGGLAVARERGDERRIFTLVLLSMLGGALALLPVLLVNSLIGLTPLILLLSMSMTMVGTGCQAMVQLAVSDAFRGRVLSIWTVVSMGMPAFGAFIMGGLADLAGFRPVLAAGAAVAILVTAVLYSFRSFRFSAAP
jgi:MFS family permease